MITDLLGMRDYIKGYLGYPVINVELDDTQIDRVIDDSVQKLNRYLYGEGTYKDIISIQLSANVSAYQLDSSIDSILDIALSNRSSINDLFTPQHQLLYNQWQGGNYPGGSYGGEAGLGGAYSMANYNISMIYLKEIQDFFAKKYTCDFNSNNYILRVYPTPEVSEPGIIQVWKKSTALELYNHPLMKKLSVGECMRLWGRILGKNIINLPGGGTINGQMMLEEGKDLISEVNESIRLETEPPGFFVG
jgi:hypothetical protein